MKNYTITVNGTPYSVTVEEGASSAPAAPVAAAPAAAPAPTPSAPKAAPAASGSQGSVKVEAPMPGNILDVKVSVGAAVTSGQVLCILEAMKMENEIRAPRDGKIASVGVAKGASVQSGTVLCVLD